MLTRDELLSRFFPHYHPVASLSQSGLSGGQVIISDGDRRACCVSRTIRLPPLLFAVSIARSADCLPGWRQPAVLLTLLVVSIAQGR